VLAHYSGEIVPNSPTSPADNRVLVKLRPSSALRAAESRANLRPLFDQATGATASFGLGAEAQWFAADLPDGAASPWDLAHARVAEQLGVNESDVLFAEPDLVHDIYPDPNEDESGAGFGVNDNCQPIDQDNKLGKAVGPQEFAWHLGDDFSQLARARAAVTFTEPRTRIGHLDTGYYPGHCTVPKHLRKDLERSFVEGDRDKTSATDPDNRLIVLDNSGHGTGTLSILAGGKVPGFGDFEMGGAPDAEVVPLRIADSVVLLRTSAFARAVEYALANHCDVITMSMGGVPSELWREAVDHAYLGGVCLVTAAGNNFHGLPTRHIVYPARYRRVIAACGVMASGKPYAHLDNRKVMEGNFGPDKSMRHAMAAYSPNIPWARFGCPDKVRLNGEGTSSATPQIAATVALWFEKYKNELPRNWRRVEAVRHALFETARQQHEKELGRGIVRALDALGVKPNLTLEQSRSDNDSWAFLRVLTGLGVAEPPPRERMFNLELEQRWLLNPELQKLVPDPEGVASLDEKTLTRFMEAVIEDPAASMALRKQIAARYPVVAGKSAPRTKASEAVIPEALPVCERQPALRNPPYRRLRVYAVDPSFSTRLDTAGINEVTLKVRWEDLDPGPSGEYLRSNDVDAAGKTNEPVHLNDPRLLAQDGWAPSEGNPQFHQQMVYAVAMKTIEHFERALGRPVLWRHAHVPGKDSDDSQFVRQLELRPHALRQANAFYSPHEVALLFGYFEADSESPGDHMSGSRVYSCLSHDIIAHETTHAILDGMHRRFNEPTNLDVLAFHEGFADIVALLQHFTIPEVLENEIRRTRGDIQAESMLGSLAVQFGQATGGRGALRDAIGRMVDGKWKRFEPNPGDLQKRLTPHTRGAVLVAAVFDAFIAIYNTRIADLIRIYTGGTGVLPNGAIHPDLVGRLTDEASKSASHVLNMCIRALDYLPPVDITFFEYLRALITADVDLVGDDKLNYRVAFVEAFRRRGIYPANLDEPTNNTQRTLSVDMLRWQGLDHTEFEPDIQSAIRKQYGAIIRRLKRYANTCFYLTDREQLFDVTRAERLKLHDELVGAFEAVPQFATELGLAPDRTFEVHELRRAMRSTPDGRAVPQIIVALTQSTQVKGDAENDAPGFTFRGGSTLVVDLSIPAVKYRIIKNIGSTQRRARTAAFVQAAKADPLRGLVFGLRREPFAALHAFAEDGV
jgi:hypothetical protein